MWWGKNKTRREEERNGVKQNYPKSKKTEGWKLKRGYEVKKGEILRWFQVPIIRIQIFDIGNIGIKGEEYRKAGWQ